MEVWLRVEECCENNTNLERRIWSKHTKNWGGAPCWHLEHCMGFDGCCSNGWHNLVETLKIWFVECKTPWNIGNLWGYAERVWQDTIHCLERICCLHHSQCKTRHATFYTRIWLLTSFAIMLGVSDTVHARMVHRSQNTTKFETWGQKKEAKPPWRGRQWNPLGVPHHYVKTNTRATKNPPQTTPPNPSSMGTCSQHLALKSMKMLVSMWSPKVTILNQLTPKLW